MNYPTGGLEPIIELRAIGELKLDPRNSKIHPKKQIEQVCKSITEYGWTNPIIIDERDNVLAGHARLKAAQELRLSHVPTIRLSHMSEAQKRAYLIADNKIAENAKWDRRLLALEHEAIQLLDPGFDLTHTGFDADEIEVLFESVLQIGERAPPVPDATQPAVSRIGDLWRLGKHLLLCGDALEASSYERLLGSEAAQLVIADNPYNVPIAGNVSSKGKHREFVQGSGELTSAQFTEFLATAFANLLRFSSDGSIHYLFMDWRHLREMLAATEQYAELKNLICWDKGSGGMGSFYRSQHELIFVTKNGTARHINNFGLGDKGRYRTNVWSYVGLNGWSPDRAEQLAMHPTVKPLALIADAIKDCSRRGGIVLDPFGGSGTTLIAAEKTGRRARLIELDPRYVDVIVRRFQSEAGQKAVLNQDGRLFDDIAKSGR